MSEPTKAPKARRQDPWTTAKAEMEPEPTTAEPNPLGTMPPPEVLPAEPSPQSAGTNPEPESESRGATLEQLRRPVRGALIGVAKLLPGDVPPTDGEVDGIAEPLADAGVPLWLVAWPIRLIAGVALFVWDRLPDVEEKPAPTADDQAVAEPFIDLPPAAGV